MIEEKEKEPGNISRREFLKDAGLILGGTAIGSTVLLAACGGDTATETVTSTKTVTTTAGGATVTTTKTEPGGTATVTNTVTNTVTKTVDGQAEAAENVISLTVNGQQYYVQVEPTWSLQFLLHDKLGIISVKDMCDRGACGACTVNMEGRPILACTSLAIHCNGKTIETAEGIADAGHPLVEAYAKNHCMQCGYCTPGFLVTAKALLDHNPNPTEDEVKEALSGNLCRCITYPRHPIAVLEAAEELGGGN